MVMDRDGNVILGGASGGSPLIVHPARRTGRIDPTFGTGGTLDAAGRSGSPAARPALLVRTDGTLTFTVAAGPATFTIVRVGTAGAPDPTFGGTGIVNVPLGPGSAPGDRRAAPSAPAPANTTLVAGTDLTATGTPRGAVIRLKPNGALDTRFGTKGITRISRAGREIRITTMVRDCQRPHPARRHRPPAGLAGVRLRANGARDNDVRQRRPHLPGARPAARRRPGLHRASTRSTSPAPRPSSSAPPRARARSCARSAARPTRAASRSPSRDCNSRHAFVEPRHVRFVLGLHQHRPQDAHAVEVHLDLRVRGGERLARRSAACSGRRGRRRPCPRRARAPWPRRSRRPSRPSGK